MSAPQLPGWPRALGADHAAAYVGLGRSTWLRLVDAGEAPKPVRLTPGRVAWLREDLDSWLDDRRRSADSQQSQKTLISHDDVRALAERLAAPSRRARGRASA